MLAVAKTPHIEFSFKGPKDALLDIVERLKDVYPIRVSDAGSVEWLSTSLHKEISSSMHGGSFLRIDMYNAGMTQKALSEATDIPQPHLSQMIAGKRPINPENAAKLAAVFGRNAKRYRISPKPVPNQIT
jgi:hypothetical protein